MLSSWPGAAGCPAARFLTLTSPLLNLTNLRKRGYNDLLIRYSHLTLVRWHNPKIAHTGQKPGAAHRSGFFLTSIETRLVVLKTRTNQFGGLYSGLNSPTRPGFPTAYFPVLSPDLFRGVLKGFPEPSQGLPEATFEPIGSVENWG